MEDYATWVESSKKLLDHDRKFHRAFAEAMMAGLTEDSDEDDDAATAAADDDATAATADDG